MAKNKLLSYDLYIIYIKWIIILYLKAFDGDFIIMGLFLGIMWEMWSFSGIIMIKVCSSELISFVGIYGLCLFMEIWA